MRESPPSESDTFPSSFHKTPERSQLTKEEWKKLTKDSTTKAVQELVSSPDFGKWAAVNADRINVTPRKGSSSKNQPRKWMRWFWFLNQAGLSFITFREKRNSFVERERAFVGKVAFFFYDLFSVLAFFFVDETTICCNDPNWVFRLRHVCV